MILVLWVYKVLSNDSTFITAKNVSYDGHLSQFAHVKLGVPQRSIIGLLMFTLFMNDIV